MIPKKIHYCWFGNSERPKVIQDIMKSWNKLQGFEIIEWNETNIDLKEHPYLEKSYNEGKYAFVSDYVRLKVLYEEGGIYLDTDVEVKKNFDDYQASKGASNGANATMNVAAGGFNF